MLPRRCWLPPQPSLSLSLLLSILQLSKPNLSQYLDPNNYFSAPFSAGDSYDYLTNPVFQIAQQTFINITTNYTWYRIDLYQVTLEPKSGQQYSTKGPWIGSGGTRTFFSLSSLPFFSFLFYSFPVFSFLFFSTLAPHPLFYGIQPNNAFENECSASAVMDLVLLVY